jgi:hypothetical protein
VYAVALSNRNSLVAKRSPRSWPVRVSSVVQVVPSFEPWSVQSRGSRSGLSLAAVSE